MTTALVQVELASIERRLKKVLEKTHTAACLGVTGWWDGDKAEERKTLDDAKTGRIAWKNAYEAAQRGLDALKDGNAELSVEYAWTAYDFYQSAIESRVRPQDMAGLGRKIGKRGRPRGSSNKKGRAAPGK